MSKFKPASFLLLLVLMLAFARPGRALYLPSNPTLAQPASGCPTPDDLPPQLEIGLWARVSTGRTHNVRADATIEADVVAQVPDGDIFRVLDGPRCADGYLWWQVDYTGQTGWMAEGDAANADYWLALLEGQESPDAESQASTTEPEGCLRPPEDYGITLVNYGQLNARTLAMLDHAQALLWAEGGTHVFRTAVMQGSYNAGRVAASFGTHDGGGAVDLSVRDPVDRHILVDEIDLMLRSLRLAGFAAWLRDTNSLYPGSPIHIHAIAVGDAELSPAAREQLDGKYGYFRGYDGLPREDGVPRPDTSGEMVLCDWMVELGFEDLRETAG